MFKTQREFDKQIKSCVDNGFLEIGSNEDKCILIKIHKDKDIQLIEVNSIDDYPISIIINKEQFDKIANMIN